MKKNNYIENIFDMKMRDGKYISIPNFQNDSPEFVICFFPAFGGNSDQYKRIFHSFLQSNSASIYFMNLRGKEDSKKGVHKVDYSDQHQHDSVDIYQHIQKKHPNVPTYIVAHSGGSSLALKLATNNIKPVVSGLYLLEPVFPSDMELYFDVQRGLYTIHYLIFQRRVMTPPPEPNFKSKWEYKYSMFKFVAGLIIPFCKNIVVLKVRESSDTPWNLYSREYMRGYTCSYVKYELRKRLQALTCPICVAVGSNDEYTYPEGLFSVVNWNVPPKYLKDVKLIKGISHFGIMPIAASLLSNWIRKERLL